MSRMIKANETTRLRAAQEVGMNQIYKVILAEDEEFVVAQTMAEAWMFMVDEVGSEPEDIKLVELLGSVWIGPIEDADG